MHEDAVRLLYHAATVKASGNVDNERLIGRAREDHWFGFRRANIFRRYQAELGLFLAALGVQQRRHPKHFSFAIPRSRRSWGVLGVVPLLRAEGSEEEAQVGLIRERDVYYWVGRRPEKTVEGETKLREAKATTLGIVLHARSRAMGGEDVVGEVKGVEEVGVRDGLFLVVGGLFFLIDGGLYSVTALRKITMRVTVYTKHQLTLQKP
jgi:hypothetical protein